MNKGELIDKLAEKTGLSKGDAKKAFEGLLDVIVETTASGEKISITGFGSFEKSHKPAGTARNPATREEIATEAKDVLKIKVSPAFSKAAYAAK